MNEDRLLDDLVDLGDLPVPADRHWSALARGRAGRIRRRRAVAAGTAGVTLAAGIAAVVLAVPDHAAKASLVPAACVPNGNPVYVKQPYYEGPGGSRTMPDVKTTDSLPPSPDERRDVPVGKADVLSAGDPPITIRRGHRGSTPIFVIRGLFHNPNAGESGPVDPLPRYGLDGGAVAATYPDKDWTARHQTFGLDDPTTVSGTVGLGVAKVVAINAASCETTTMPVVGKDLGLGVGWFWGEQRGAGPVTIKAYDAKGHLVAQRVSKAWPPAPEFVPPPPPTNSPVG